MAKERDTNGHGIMEGYWLIRLVAIIRPLRHDGEHTSYHVVGGHRLIVLSLVILLLLLCRDKTGWLSTSVLW